MGEGLPTGFADPWEHIRLLSDRRRNRAYLDLLDRFAPGARVVEVGCGTGLLSAYAAARGARRVVAIEPTPLAEVARALMARNGLVGVEVHRARVAALRPEPADLVFSELLNADPFLEGILAVSDDAARWVAPGGHLAPSRLRVLAAAVAAVPSIADARHARAALTSIEADSGLDLSPVHAAVGDVGTYRYLAEVDDQVGSAEVLWEIPLGVGWEPPETMAFSLPTTEPAGGVAVWWEAELAPGLWVSNAPGSGGHWGQLVCAWTDPPTPRRGRIHLRVEVDALELTIHPDQVG